MSHPSVPASVGTVEHGQRHDTVGVVLVSRDGARWLPAVLDGLAAQTVRPAHVRAVDAGSKDGSGELMAAALGAGAVLSAGGGSGFPTSVARAVQDLPDTEWLWLLHDDARPEPDALERLLAAAADHPDAQLFGPKLREWPSLRRLLELGVTISGTGRRETGLERGEYDQGQHDEVREVLAVNTAGLLVRRRVFEALGGLDEQLPVFGNDLDLGWRAARAGHRTMVVPDAVVFHAEAAHRGVRRTPLTGRHTHYAERRAALWILLVNAPAPRVPLRLVRLIVGTLLRVVGFLLVRSVGEALDELAALVSVCAHPRELRRARARRSAAAPSSPRDVGHLLAPWWLPYRHGLDLAGDLVSAATVQAQDVAERRRAAKADAGRPGPADAGSAPPRRERGGPVDPEDEVPAEDTGVVARFLTSPVAVAVALFVLLALVGAADAFGAISAPGLPAAPGAAADWWRLHVESAHPLGLGSTVPAPAYVPVLALLASLLGVVGGGPSLLVSLLLVLAVPAAFWGAWRLLRVIGHLGDPRGAPRGLLALGAAAYALVPVTSGAWGQGRLGVVVAAALLPWLAHAALGFADPDGDRRWRAAWRTGLLLAVTTAFTPVAWPFALLLLVVVLVAAVLLAPTAVRDRSTWGPPVVAVAVVPVLLAPWLLPLLWSGSAAGLLLETGRLPVPDVGTLGLLVGRLGATGSAVAGAPVWVGALVVGLAVVALVPRRTRVAVLVCWLVALVAVAVAAGLSHVVLELPATTSSPGLGWFVVLVQGALVSAAFTGGLAVPDAWSRAGAGRSWRRVLPGAASAAALVAALAVPVVGLGWFLVADDGLDAGRDDGIPEYMAQAAASEDGPGVLVLRGDVEGGLTWSVYRGDGPTVGEDEVLALTPEATGLSADVRGLVSAPTPALVSGLAERGLGYVVLPRPADGRVAAVLDSATGLEQASAEDRSTRAWAVAPGDGAEVDGDAVASRTTWWRWVLVVGQAVAVLVVGVLCGPTRKESR